MRGPSAIDRRAIRRESAQQIRDQVQTALLGKPWHTGRADRSEGSRPRVRDPGNSAMVRAPALAMVPRALQAGSITQTEADQIIAQGEGDDRQRQSQGNAQPKVSPLGRLRTDLRLGTTESNFYTPEAYASQRIPIPGGPDCLLDSAPKAQPVRLADDGAPGKPHRRGNLPRRHAGWP
jgi:hypothetical protein